MDDQPIRPDAYQTEFIYILTSCVIEGAVWYYSRELGWH